MFYQTHIIELEFSTCSIRGNVVAFACLVEALGLPRKVRILLWTPDFNYAIT